MIIEANIFWRLELTCFLHYVVAGGLTTANLTLGMTKEEMTEQWMWMALQECRGN